MPRTTIQIKDDALAVAKAHASRHRTTLGEAVSTLVRQGAARPIVTAERNGFRVLRLDTRSPKVTATLVESLIDEQR